MFTKCQAVPRHTGLILTQCHPVCHFLKEVIVNVIKITSILQIRKLSQVRVTDPLCTQLVSTSVACPNGIWLQSHPTDHTHEWYLSQTPFTWPANEQRSLLQKTRHKTKPGRVRKQPLTLQNKAVLSKPISVTSLPWNWVTG